MPEIGDPAPLFSGDDVVNGGTFSLEDHQGKIVLVAFNGLSRCSPCRLEAPILQELWDEYDDSIALPRVQFVVVSFNEELGALQNAIEEFGLTMPVVHNSDVPPMYEVSGVPVLWVVEPGGTLCARKLGASKPEEKLKKDIRQLLVDCGAPDPLYLPDYGDWAAMATILFGVISDGGGLVLTPGGVPKPIDPWGPLLRMGAAKREALVALAVGELAKRLRDPESRVTVERAAARALQSAAQTVARRVEPPRPDDGPTWMPAR
ncbi:MAG: TlpA family protein disulfide reductase [Actinomycetota bacterium]|nr:TlpA family protein disulfide reductase [Actinomycetota bacterium]